MTDHTTWRYTFILVFSLLIIPTVSQKVCQGTEWGEVQPNFVQASERYRQMETTFSRCTHVLGNVEITWQMDSSLDFSFLEQIEDVSGYVLVTKSYLPYIPLPKLTIIRGEVLFKGNALYVSYNYNETSDSNSNPEHDNGLLQLQLVSLKEILNGGVLIYKNHVLCYARTIDWTDILPNGTDYEVTYPFIQCNECHPNCSGGCWGEGQNMCQTLYRKNCHSSCSFGCYGNDSEQCCDLNCAGGCTAQGPQNCLACRNLRNGSTCVDKCPDGLIVETGYCVSSCQDMWTPKNGVCEFCGSACPSKCVGIDFSDNKNQYLNDDSIEAFEGCTHVENNLIITDQSFVGAFYHGIIPIEYEDLYKLMNIEVIDGYLLLANFPMVTDDTFFDLSFLGKLREVGGEILTSSGASITIDDMDNLRTLQLKSLKTVRNGDVVITDNSNLCFVDDEKWLNGILQNTSSQSITINGNYYFRDCVSEEYICDPQCQHGCWGHGADLCASCVNYKIGDFCVESCNGSSGQYLADVEEKLCNFCHPQCAVNCTGPGPSECFACKNVLDGDTCKEECPQSKYLSDKNVCEPCHDNCVLGCTGPTNLQSLGGCNECYVIESVNDDKKCLPREATCKSNFYEINAVAGARLCLECNKLCATCIEESSNCITCNLYNVKGECVEKCDTNQFRNQSMFCVPCNEECADDCSGPTAMDCKNCAHKQIEIDGAMFECVVSCPKDLVEGICSEGSSSTAGIVIGLVVAVLFIIVMLVLIGYCYFRRKRESEKYYDLPLAVEVPLHDAKFNRVTARASGRAPNKAKLTISKQTEIIKGLELGAGAFGTVYSGFWLPDNKRFRIPVAIKVLQDLSPSSSDELLAESGVMATVEHRCVLRLLAVCMSSPMMMLTQLMPLGALLDYVRKNHDQIGAYHLLNWSMQISEGMEYLESKHLIHRDLAARNVLVQSPNQVKITDFGLAKFLDVDEQKFLAEGGKVAVKWLAPECLKYALFTHESDVWSFGVTVWELMTFGSKPYEGHRARDVLDLIDKGERLKQPPICTIDVYMLLLKCWVIDANARPRFSYLVEEFGKMAQDPQRFVVIENDDEKQLPAFNKDEFYSDFFENKFDLKNEEANGLLGNGVLVEAEDYLTPMDMSSESCDNVPPGEAEYVNEEPVNHYQDLITEKLEESDDEFTTGIHEGDGMNKGSPPIPVNPGNLGDYMGLSELTDGSMAIGPHISNPEYDSMPVLPPSPTSQGKNPWDRKPTGPKKDNKKGKRSSPQKGRKNQPQEAEPDSGDSFITNRPRAVSNVYVDDEMRVASMDGVKSEKVESIV